MAAVTGSGGGWMWAWCHQDRDEGPRGLLHADEGFVNHKSKEAVSEGELGQDTGIESPGQGGRSIRTWEGAVAPAP